MNLLLSIVLVITLLIAGVGGSSFAATFYVATTGDDSNNCTQTQNPSSPKRNIMGMDGGIACMQTPGDTLVIREGNYTESISNNTVPYSLPSGTDWDNAFTVAAYPGESVTIRGISIATDDNFHLSYWIFDGN